MRVAITTMLCYLGLAGCSNDPRRQALALSDAGIAATHGLAGDVDARIDRLQADRAAQDFVAGYNILSKCPAITHGSSNNPDCDTATIAAQRSASPVAAQFALLGDVVEKRAAALSALGAAYAALGAEANYDAPADLTDKIGAATAAANTLAKTVGLPPIGEPVGVGVKLVGGVLAARAQRHRLLKASHEIAGITGQMRSALVKERALFGELDTLLANLDDETRRTLLKAGLLDTSRTVKAIAANAGVPVADAAVPPALGSNPVLRGAAEVALLDGAAPVSDGDLDAGIALLSDLEAQHDRFEAGSPIDGAQLSADADRLAALVAAIRRE